MNQSYQIMRCIKPEVKFSTISQPRNLPQNKDIFLAAESDTRSTSLVSVRSGKTKKQDSAKPYCTDLCEMKSIKQ